MNEDIQEVRRMLAPANQYPPGSLTGSGADAAGRADFERAVDSLAAASSTKASRHRGAARRGGLSRWAGMRLIAVGGLAVAIAVGATVVENLGGHDSAGKPHPIVPGLPAEPVANAQVVLNKAANVVQSRPFVTPRPDQWVFQEVRHNSVGMPAKGEVRTPGSPRRTMVDASWIKADGTKDAFVRGGRLRISGIPSGGSPPFGYAAIARLPSNPDALLAWARKDDAAIAGGPDAIAFQTLSGMVVNNMMPPAQQVGIYRALAKIPGVEVTTRATDGLGHPVLSVSRVIEGWVRDEILLDPATYACRGSRDTVVKDHTMPDAGTFKKGTVMDELTSTATGVVDRPGQRP